MKPRHHRRVPERRVLGRRVLGLGVLLLSAFLLLGGSVLIGLVGIGGPSASAAAPPWEPDPGSVGALTFFNAAGQQITGGNLTDSPIAAYVEGTATVRSGDTVATLYGYLPKNGQAPAAWSGDQLGGSTTFPNASAPAPLNTATLPVETGAPGDETISTLEADYPNTDTSNDGYAGLYQLRLYTNAAHKTQTTTYDSADILISGSTWSVVYPAPTAISTTTTLTSVIPTSPEQFGTSETLTATVAPAAATGTVQFSANGTAVGSPVTVSGGSAQLVTTALPVGNPDTLTAAFTPTSGNGYAASQTSSATDFVVNPISTTTTLTGVSPAVPTDEKGWRRVASSWPVMALNSLTRSRGLLAPKTEPSA